ncbi:MAG: DNA-3-methyladenine glycosylase 2 family protein [Candidatus Rokubacteria bacterium]|nr:DNA-3-methyladenine glycosylase 2 family protein [Candidatus Rokubacteria bacterium]
MRPLDRIRLAPRGPLAFDLTLERYRLWGEDPANLYRAGVFRRVARADGRLVPYALRAGGSVARPRLEVALAPVDAAGSPAAVRAEVRWLLGLDADLAGFYALAQDDPVLAGLIRPFYGMRPPLAPEPFEMLVGAITAQQVNLGFALATRARLVRRFGRPRRVDGALVWAFPTPETLARARVAELRALQFSTRKAEYIIGLGRVVAEGRLDLEALRRCESDEVIARLTALRGLGRWTAEWFLLRALGRGGVCPADDLGVRKAFGAFCFGGREVDADRIRRYAARWGAYQNLAVHYLLAGARLRATFRSGPTPPAGGPGGRSKRRRAGRWHGVSHERAGSP